MSSTYTSPFNPKVDESRREHFNSPDYLNWLKSAPKPSGRVECWQHHFFLGENPYTKNYCGKCEKNETRNCLETLRLLSDDLLVKKESLYNSHAEKIIKYIKNRYISYPGAPVFSDETYVEMVYGIADIIFNCCDRIVVGSTTVEWPILTFAWLRGIKREIKSLYLAEERQSKSIQTGYLEEGCASMARKGVGHYAGLVYDQRVPPSNEIYKDIYIKVFPQGGPHDKFRISQGLSCRQYCKFMFQCAQLHTTLLGGQCFSVNAYSLLIANLGKNKPNYIPIIEGVTNKVYEKTDQHNTLLAERLEIPKVFEAFKKMRSSYY